METSNRRVRSFVRRAGRLTPAQRRALDEYWPQFGIDYSVELLDFAGIFGRTAERVMEIGFGNGSLLVQRAAAHPEQDFLGVEVHEPGVGHCLLALQQAQLTNVRLLRHDAIEVLMHQIPDRSLSEVDLFFPDPWPKKRHHKRRIVQPAFVALIGRKLVAGGLFHAATDWQDYADHIETVMRQNSAFAPVENAAIDRPKTRFERRGEGLGHDIHERIYRYHAVYPKPPK